ncbi:MAG: hypothetical protein JNM70_01925 [Anaerolineae bacterium]|nr:hypothetical protein [Anaerolineae bacterium]
MLPPDRAQTFDRAPMGDLISVLLRQLKRPLAAHGFTLSDAQADVLAQARLAGQADERIPALLTALEAVIAESVAALGRFGLRFQESLDADMNQIGGWKSTAEFLEIANEKSNAELRITLASALALAFGGDRRYGVDLLHLARGEYGDETVIARRFLSFASGIQPVGMDWAERIAEWISPLI